MSSDLYRSDSDVGSDEETAPTPIKVPIKKTPVKKARVPTTAAVAAAGYAAPVGTAPVTKPALKPKIDRDARDARIAAKRAEIAARKAASAEIDKSSEGSVKCSEVTTEVSVVRDKVYICYGIYLTTAPSTYKPSELESFGIKYEKEASRTLYYTVLDEFETEPAGIRKIPGDLATLLKYQGLFGMIYHASPLSEKKSHATQWRTDVCSPFYFVKY